MKKLKEGFFLLPALLLGIAAIAGIMWNTPEFPGIHYPNEEVEELTKKEDNSTKNQNNGHTEVKKEIDTATLDYKDKGSLKDGTYVGNGTGFGGNIAVQVTIADGKIVKINVTSHSGETPSYFSRAMAVVNRILAAQSPNVDMVSGATYSSKGIRDAVIQALQKAGGKISSNKTVSLPNKNVTSTTTTKKKQKKNSSGEPADGIYTGEAVCEVFGYTLSLKVTFRDGKAVSISNLKITNNNNSANAAYWKKAWKPTVKRILQKQSSEVDVVSGATYSSNAIVSAYLDAKDKAIQKNSKSKKKRQNNTKKKTSKVPAPNITDTNIKKPMGQVTDGLYTVSAVCDPDKNKAFASYMLTADVVFAKGKLASISNFSSSAESNRSYYLKAANGSKKYPGVVTQLLTKQSTSGISAVSGATCSSKTIFKLYLMALEKATGSKQDDTSNNMSSTPSQDQSGDNTSDEDKNDNQSSGSGEEDSGNVKDGTYAVTVTVLPDEWEDFSEYTLTADVTFLDHKLSGIDNLVIDSDATNKSYCMMAANGSGSQLGIIEQLIGRQNSKVDTVSGATCSSKALIELYENAMKMAKEGEE